MSNKSLDVEVLPPAKPAKPAIVPKLTGGGDAETAKHLTKLFKDAQTGMRRIVALGLFAWEIKETKLKHGEWGGWLAAHAPQLCRLDSETQKPKASNALNNFMDLTKSVLESVGVKSLTEYFETVAKFPRGGNLTEGRLLLLPEKQIPIEAKPLRDKIFALVDNKTQRQLFLEFKQADEDSDKPKRGRLKGSAGLTKEQREKAAARAEQERLNELEETILDNITWLLEIADAKNLGAMESKLIQKFCDAADTASGYGKRVMESRKTAPKATEAKI